MTGDSMRSLERNLGWIWLALASPCCVVGDPKGSLVLGITFVPPDL